MGWLIFLSVIFLILCFLLFFYEVVSKKFLTKYTMIVCFLWLAIWAVQFFIVFLSNSSELKLILN